MWTTSGIHARIIQLHITNNMRKVTKNEGSMNFVKEGETHTYYDDGKITPSRKHKVEILEVIPFENADKVLITEWQEEVKECYWLYSEKTSQFIKAKLYLTYFEPEIIYFVETKDGRWFSLGDWAGLLYINKEEE